VQQAPVEATRLAHVSDGLGDRHLIDGRGVLGGDELEVWLPCGWTAGEFGWMHSCHSWPRLAVCTGPGRDEVLLAILAAGVTCRWRSRGTTLTLSP
jgi:hypothetical protein